MKKLFEKVVALVLTLVLSFGAMPMVVSAEEVTAAPPTTCTHPHLFESHFLNYTAFNDVTYHIRQEVDAYLCAVCGYSAEEIVSTTYEKHVIQQWTWVEKQGEYDIYRGICEYCKQDLYIVY